MALAGHATVVYLKSTSASAGGSDEVDGVKDVSITIDGELLDITDFKDTTGWHLKMQGLKSSKLSLSGNAERADAPQNLLRADVLDGSSVWATIHTNPGGSSGQKGFKAEYKVESYDEKATVDGTVDWSASLQSTGAVAAE